MSADGAEEDVTVYAHARQALGVGRAKLYKFGADSWQAGLVDCEKTRAARIRGLGLRTGPIPALTRWANTFRP
jgi:hypothetical protein